MRDFQAAERLLAEARAAYRELGERHLEGRVLMNVANLLHMQGRVQESVAAMEQAAASLDFDREPLLELLLKQNIAAGLMDLDRLKDARAMLSEVRELARRLGNRSQRLRLRWLEALLFKRLGQVELAEQVLTQVREGFVAAGIGYDVALVSLDLATLYLESGRTSQVLTLAEETYHLFTSRGVHREALAAWRLFRQAAERETVTIQLLDEVASRIRHAPGRSPEPALTS